MTVWQKFVAWLRRMFRLYEKEIKEFVDDMLDLAFQNLDEQRKDKIDPAIRKKIANQVLANIIIMGIDIGTIQGRSEVGKLIMDAIDWFTKEGE